MSDKLPGMSFSKWKRLRECALQFYEYHLRPSDIELVETPSDTTRAFIGSVVQHIMEMAINKRLYKEYDFERLCEVIDSDLKLLKPLMFSLEEIDGAVDGWAKFPIEGATELEEVQRCAIELSEKGYDNIYYAQNSIIKKIRLMYKKPLELLLSHPDIDLMRSEVPIRVASEHFYHQGEIDFVVEYPDYIDIIEGKKSYTDWVDVDQAYHYKLIGELKYQKPVRKIDWLIYDEGKYYPVEHEGKATELLTRMKERWDWLESKGWKNPEDYPPTKNRMGCMFCIRNDNCLGTGTLKDEIDCI